MADYWVCLQAEEYEKLGSYALIGLPTELYEKRCVPFCSCYAPCSNAHTHT